MTPINADPALSDHPVAPGSRTEPGGGPVPDGISLDRVRRQLVLDPTLLGQYPGSGGAGAVSVGFGMPPDPAAPQYPLPPASGRQVRGAPQPVHIPCPAHLGLSDRVILTLHSATKARQISIRLGDLPDCAAAVLRVSPPRFEALRGRLHLSGWSHHPTPPDQPDWPDRPDQIVLLAEQDGVTTQLATAVLGLPRKVLAERNPFLAADCGWRIDAPLTAPLLTAPLLAAPLLAAPLLAALCDDRAALVIQTRSGGTILTRTPLTTLPALLRSALTPAVQQQVRALQRAAVKAQGASTARLRWLLASEAFRRRWDGPQDALGWLIRAEIANALVPRLRPGDEIALRLATGRPGGAGTGGPPGDLAGDLAGDLVLCQPVDDSVLARRFLFNAGDELGFLDWIRTRVQPGDTVIDAGAAYGVVSRTMARAGARVIAVEADPLSAGRIRRSQMQFAGGQNAGVQNAGVQNAGGHITLIEAAIADRPGTVVFAGMGGSSIGSGKIIASDAPEIVAAFLAEISGLNQVPLSGQDTKERRRFGPQDVAVRHITATTLDQICADHGLRDVALVKIDIEGGELLALRGATRLLDGAFGLPPVVAFEYSALFATQGGQREEILDLFFDRGWKIYRLAQGKTGGGDLIPIASHAGAPQHDNLVAVPPGRF